MKNMKLLIEGLVFFILAVFYSANFNSNLFGLGRPGQFDQFQMDSEESVRIMLLKTARDGYWSTGGFMMGRKIDDEPYFSQWGLQGKIASACYLMSGKKPTFIRTGHLVVAILFGCMLSLFTIYLSREFSWFVAIVFAFLVNLSDWLVFAGRNIYVAYFLHLLPFILSLMLFPLVLKGGRFKFKHFLWAIGAAHFAKALSYFDYSTNIVLSAAIGPLFYGILERKTWRDIFRWMAITIGVGVGVVAISIVMVAIQTALYTGSWSTCFDHLIKQAVHRSLASEANPVIGAPAGVTAWMIFEQYLTLPMISLPFAENPNRYRIYFSLYASIALLLPLAMCALLDRKVFPRFENEHRRLMAFAVATAWGLAASLSWPFLMRGHMYHHMHMNGMLFYIPYMLMLYIFFAMIIRLLGLQVWDWIRAKALPVYETPPGAPAAEAKPAKADRKK